MKVHMSVPSADMIWGVIFIACELCATVALMFVSAGSMRINDCQHHSTVYVLNVYVRKADMPDVSATTIPQPKNLHSKIVSTPTENVNQM